MDKHTFNELVNKKYITEVGRVDYYKNNDEALESLKMEDLSSIVTNSVVGGFVGLPDFSQGGEFKLEKDINLLYPIVIEKDTVIDLNGYNIINNTTFIDESDGSDNCYAFWVKSGKLTIKGKGEVEATANSSYDMAVWANGGNVEIYGGSYSNRGDSCDLIYASAGGNVTIFGGEFMAGGPASGKAEGTKNPYCALNVKDADYKAGKSNIVVKGGKFYNFDPANNVSETAETNFLAPGYISVEVVANVFVVEDTSSDIVVDEGEFEE